MTMTFQIKNGDLVLAGSGRPRLLADNEKLSQDLMQMLGQSPDVEGFGAGLDQLIGMDGDPFGLSASISGRIYDSVSAYQEIQQRYQLGARTSEEMLSYIARLVVSLSERGKTTFNFRFDAVSVAGTSPVTVAGAVVV